MTRWECNAGPLPKAEEVTLADGLHPLDPVSGGTLWDPLSCETRVRRIDPKRALPAGALASGCAFR